jgi:flagellar biosynthesis protein FlhA
LDHAVEETIQHAVKTSGQGSFLAIEPKTARSILEAIGKHIDRFKDNLSPVLLCPAPIRLHVKKMTERYFPDLAVVSHNEVAPQFKIQSLGTVKLHAS